jgi:hypothetical protein
MGPRRRKEVPPEPALRCISISEQALRDAGVSVEAAREAVGHYRSRFAGKVPDGAIQREWAAQFFGTAQLQALAVAVFRAWEAEDAGPTPKAR